MPDVLYDTDILEWSEQQAALLRRAAGGERVSGLDWDNLVEEVEAVGRSELHACKSLLLQALRHLLKCHGWPGSIWTRHWKAECDVFLFQAREAYAPSMARRIDLPTLYRKALSATRFDLIDGQDCAALPEVSPFSLADLLTEQVQVDALLARLGQPAEERDH